MQSNSGNVYELPAVNGPAIADPLGSSSFVHNPMDLLSFEVLDRLNALVRSLREQELSKTTKLADTPNEFILRGIAGRFHKARRRRSARLPGVFLGEPVWDILLALYAAGEAMSGKGACLASGVPFTTAFRWIAALEQRGLVLKSGDSEDARRVTIRLTVEGERIMRETIVEMIPWLNGEAIAIAPADPAHGQRAGR